MIGIICALPEELMGFGPKLQITAAQRIGDVEFHQGYLAGVPVTLVECGIGKVNAAFAATILCSQFQVAQIVFSGIAGGIDPILKVGDMVVATELIQFDYGKYQQGKLITYPPNARPTEPLTGDIAYHLPHPLITLLQQTFHRLELPVWQGQPTQLVYGKIITGDVFLNDSAHRAHLFQQFGAQAIEMEGAAVAQIAQKFGVPTVVIRALSDLAGDDSHLDFRQFAPHAGCAAALLVEQAVLALAPTQGLAPPQP